MNVPSALTVTEPLPVLAEPLNVNGSLLASVADTLPVMRPFATLGEAAFEAPATGAVFVGLIATVTGIVTDPPYPSDTVTVKVSLVADEPAPILAAACRAAAVGV